MRRSSSQNFTASLLLIAGIVATVYLLFIFSNALWKSQKQEKLFAEFQAEIERLEKENRQLAERYALQRTKQFIDRYAKANLGKVNPGERVIVLPEEEEEKKLNFEGLTPSEIEIEILKNRPIREQWWHVFFEQT